MTTQCIGGLFGIFFTSAPRVSRLAEVMACDVALFQQFFHGMLAAGVSLAPSAFEAGFVSAAHSEEDIATTLSAAKDALAACKKNRPG